MKLTVKHKFLVFPVCSGATEKTLAFSLNGTPVYQLKIKLDASSPDFYAYVDLSRFMGETLSLSVTPEVSITYRESDEMDIPDAYREAMRPLVHFTTKNGWINDPNGLIYVDGLYHMFYQYNPCEPRWNNMHWGHAVSPDLVHWEERDTVLFPDETGQMFSGSAILDEKNLLGLQEGETPTVLLYYTATEPCAQYLAYSTDGLMTVKKYGNAPVVPPITAENRDPMVVFCEEWDAYLMTLYTEGDEFLLLRSEDLLSFRVVQRFHLEGDRECPGLFPITAEDGARKWVFMGAKSRYAVGDMREDGFHPDGGARSLHYGASAYAGQIFANMPSKRCVRMDWDIWHLSTPRFSGQMSIPHELLLRKDGEGEYELVTRPVKELDALVTDRLEYQGLALAENTPTTLSLNEGAWRVDLIAKDAADGVLTLTAHGRSLTLDLAANEVRLGDKTAPIRTRGTALDLTLVLDRCSMELFLDGGAVYLGTAASYTVADQSLPLLTLTADKHMSVDSLTLSPLSPIRREQYEKSKE